MAIPKAATPFNIGFNLIFPATSLLRYTRLVYGNTKNLHQPFKYQYVQYTQCNTTNITLLMI